MAGGGVTGAALVPVDDQVDVGPVTFTHRGALMARKNRQISTRASVRLRPAERAGSPSGGVAGLVPARRTVVTMSAASASSDPDSLARQSRVGEHWNDRSGSVG